MSFHNTCQNQLFVFVMHVFVPLCAILQKLCRPRPKLVTWNDVCEINTFFLSHVQHSYKFAQQQQQEWRPSCFLFFLLTFFVLHLNQVEKLKGHSICKDTDADLATVKIEKVEINGAWFLVYGHGYGNGLFWSDHVAICAVPYGLTDGRVSHLRHFLYLFSPCLLAGGKARVIQPCLTSAKSRRAKQSNS